MPDVLFGYLGRCLSLALILGLPACRSSMHGPVIARVNGELIHARAVEHELAFGAAEGLTWEGALEGLVDLALIRQEGGRLGLGMGAAREAAEEQAQALLGEKDGPVRAVLKDKGITEKEWRQRLRLAAEADEVIRQELRNKMVLSRQEIQDFYWEHLPQYRLPAKRRLRMIYTRTRAAAEKAERELHLGEAFADVAARLGRGPEKNDGGLLGPVALSNLPKALSKAVLELKPGGRTRIVASSWGYHILAEEGRSPGRALSLDEALPQARQDLQAIKEQDYYRSWLGRLRAQADIQRFALPTPVPPPVAKTGQKKPKKKG